MEEEFEKNIHCKFKGVIREQTENYQEKKAEKIFGQGSRTPVALTFNKEK
ncbi:hypothetical protein [Brachyspira hyodysenteriae]|nr:hypothetical protein [Brachyspira hyodysenteriae]MDA0081613.1 hypothetical protein [Brachyspira hyodysenteriae]